MDACKYFSIWDVSYTLHKDDFDNIFIYITHNSEEKYISRRKEIKLKNKRPKCENLLLSAYQQCCYHTLELIALGEQQTTFAILESCS